jgi:CBS domain containing-hemolysin-like protein
VYDAENNERFVGTLFLHDLVGLKKSGVVSQVMRQEVYYMHEEEQLAHALHAFLKTNHHLFVVVNTFEEFVGVVSIEDVLEQILGRQIVDEFDQYADLRAVARSMADKERAHRVQKQAKQPKK